MYKENYLAAFIERLNTYQVIYTTPFLVLYEYWFIEVSDHLYNEIDENLLLLDKEKHKKYLEIVLSKIKKNIIYIQNPLLVDKWIEKYDLSKYEFPFLENKEVQQNLATSISQDNLDYEKKKIATNMQIDFYCYAAIIEVQKMIYFIDNILSENNDFIDKPILSKSVKPNLKTKKISEKWYALQYLLELRANNLKPPTNNEGGFIKSEIEHIGKLRISNSTGQNFYKKVRFYIDTIDNAKSIEKSFGKDWKETILLLSNNDKIISDFIEKNY
jgi:hypothetical protein